MKTDTQNHGSVAVIVPHGPLTTDELDGFQNTVRTALSEKHGRVVIDMNDVPYLDSSGIETLLDLTNNAAAGSRPRFAHLEDACREALDLTNALKSLEVFDTVESAVRSYKR